jgi:pimeloyl-ACP methyl ester carboxylesterase
MNRLKRAARRDQLVDTEAKQGDNMLLHHAKVLLATLTVTGLAPACTQTTMTDRTEESSERSSAAQHRQTDPALDYANRNVHDGLFFTEGYFEHEGLTLHYVEAGQGELVILYHGFPSFWFSFYDQMVALKNNYRVVAVDGLGAGLSDKPDDLSHYKVEALVAQLDALAAHLSPGEKFTLIGHDWGGALAMAYAEALPERLNAVITLNAPSFNVFLDILRSNEQQQKTSTYMAVMAQTPQQEVRDDSPGARILKSAYTGLLERGEIPQEEYSLFGWALEPAAATNGGYNWYRANVPAPDQIGETSFYPQPPQQISVPSLLIWGTEDRAFVPEFIDQMRSVTPGLQVVIIEGANHWSMISHPEAANSAIEAFLDEVLTAD